MGYYGFFIHKTSAFSSRHALKVPDAFYLLRVVALGAVLTANGDGVFQETQTWLML